MAKILDIVPYKILPAQMGGQKGIAIFCKYLGQQNELTCVSVMENDPSFAENYELIRLFNNSRARYLSPFYVNKIKRIIRERNIRNVITEHPYMAWMGWMLKKQLKVKWFVHSHNIEYERFRTLGKSWSPLLRVYEQWAYRNADAVLFKTEEDIHFAVKRSIIKPVNSLLVPYGIELKELPADIGREKEKIYALHDIPRGCKLLFFNGALSYKPNTDALEFILSRINPLLLKQPALNYRILICGKDLPLSFAELKGYVDKNIIYAGFVNDVVPYFKAADLFINPIVSGGGVKTKVVDAIGYGVTVVSCNTGAAGINIAVCGEKIRLAPDNDEAAFAAVIKENLTEYKPTPASYYEYYYWGNIIKRFNSYFE